MYTITRRSALALGLGALAACAQLSGRSLAPNSRLILVRHAERDELLLSRDGHERAAALPVALDGIAIDEIRSPGITRNLDTAMPLAEARGLEITRTPLSRIDARLANAAAGRSVVWVGNRDNLRTIWEGLGLPGDPPIVYGEMFIVESDASGRVTVDRRHFGTPPT